MDVLYPEGGSSIYSVFEESREFVLHSLYGYNHLSYLVDCSSSRLMTVFKNPFFFISALLFWINQGAEKLFGQTPSFIRSYQDDLLAMPVILGVTLQIFQWIHPLKSQFRFTWVQCLVGFLYVSVAFEGVLPIYSETYTRDYWDIVFYAIGTFGFYKLINPKARPQISQG